MAILHVRERTHEPTQDEDLSPAILKPRTTPPRGASWMQVLGEPLRGELGMKNYRHSYRKRLLDNGDRPIFAI